MEMHKSLPSWRSSCISYPSSEGQFEGGNDSQKEESSKQNSNELSKNSKKEEDKSQESE